MRRMIVTLGGRVWVAILVLLRMGYGMYGRSADASLVPDTVQRRYFLGDYHGMSCLLLPSQDVSLLTLAVRHCRRGRMPKLWFGCTITRDEIGSTLWTHLRKSKIRRQVLNSMACPRANGG